MSSSVFHIRSALCENLSLKELASTSLEIFGRTRSELRRAGQFIPDLNLLIGATAIHYDLILMTRNVRHFARVRELHLYQPG